MLFSWYQGDLERMSLGRYALWIQRALEGQATFEQLDGTHFNLPGMLRRRIPGQADYRELPPHWEGTADLVHAIDVWQAVHHSRFDQPFMVTVHDLIPRVVLRMRRGPRNWLGVWQFERSLRAARKAAHILTPSEFTRDELIAAGFAPERITAAPVMLPHHFAAPPEQVAETLTLPPGPLILSVGTTQEYKNVPLALSALAEPELRRATLVRVGGLTTAHRRLAARLGVEARIHEVGSVTEQQLLELYWRCTVLAQPSLTEGFGMPVAEAMACGLPSVISNGGALPEVGGDAAVVVPLSSFEPHVVARDDVRALAAALARVINDEGERERLRAAGFERVKAFRPEVVGPQVLRVYREVAGRT